MTKIAVTGYDGRLGSALVLAGCHPLVCDITKPEQIIGALYNRNFSVIINCAALTNVDAAEDEKEYKKFIEVNTRGVANLRDNFSGRIIQISTDYVFGGQSGPYRENARSEAPVNNYGYSKLGGEAVITASAYPGDTIVRTTGLFGSPHVKSDFVSMVVSNVRRGEPVEITRSLMGNQTYIPFLVDHLIQLAEMKDRIPKLLHLGSSDVISRYDFALEIAKVFNLYSSYILPVNRVDDWKAKRPTKGGLVTEISKKLGFIPYTSLEGLQDMYEMEQK